MDHKPTPDLETSLLVPVVGIQLVPVTINWFNHQIEGWGKEVVRPIESKNILNR